MKRGKRGGKEAGKTYARVHASVAERSRIVLLFNSDRVIDLARLSCVRTHIRASAKHTWLRLLSVAETRAKVLVGLGARRRGKVSFNDFDMGGRHVPPCNLHYSRDVPPAKHRRGSSGRCRAVESQRER